jgi:hypothetical protein
MRIRLSHVPYIAKKIAIDISKNKNIKIETTLENIIEVSKEVLIHDLKQEKVLEERVNELIEEQEENFEFLSIDYKEVFSKAKRKLAKEYGVILNQEDRYNNIAHLILDELWQAEVISYKIAENKVKNMILTSIESYVNAFSEIEDIAFERIQNYKRKLVPGSEEYEMVFSKLYEEELVRRGLN